MNHLPQRDLDTFEYGPEAALPLIDAYKEVRARYQQLHATLKNPHTSRAVAEADTQLTELLEALALCGLTSEQVYLAAQLRPHYTHGTDLIKAVEAVL